ncbi:MAG: hypothetical protein O2940_02335 [Actinomycetota bacterium]|nr:hypothetical protein [Actinomycetota bacterium]
MNTHASDRGNEPVTWNQFHTFANQMDTNFSIVNSRIHETHREILEVRAQFIQLDEKIIRLDQRINRLDDRINGLDEKINLLRGEFLEFKEEMRLVPVKIAGWVAGAMIGSSSVIFGGFQLLRGFL